METAQKKRPGRPRKALTLDDLLAGRRTPHTLRAVLLARFDAVATLRRDGLTWAQITEALNSEYSPRKPWQPGNVRKTWAAVCGKMRENCNLGDEQQARLAGLPDDARLKGASPAPSKAADKLAQPEKPKFPPSPPVMPASANAESPVRERKEIDLSGVGYPKIDMPRMKKI